MKAAILAPGSSLTQEVADAVRAAGYGLVVAVTDAYLLAPWAHVLYAFDAKWWENHPDALGFAGARLSGSDTAGTLTIGSYVEQVPFKKADSDEAQASAVVNYSNSGQNAIRAVADVGCFRQIDLYGFDRRPGHCHDRHNPQTRPKPTEYHFALWAHGLDQIIRDLAHDGIEVRRVVTFDDGPRIENCLVPPIEERPPFPAIVGAAA